LINEKEETYVYGQRKLVVQWRTVNKEHVKGWIIEFDVHPSTFWFTMSNSDFICIKDESHFNEVKNRLLQSDDYSFILANTDDL